MQFNHRCRRANTNITLGVNSKGIGWCASRYPENLSSSIRVFNRKIICTAIRGVINNNPPVICRKTGRSACILKMDSKVILLNSERVEAKAFSVNAILTYTVTSYSYYIIEMNNVSLQTSSASAEE